MALSTKNANNQGVLDRRTKIANLREKHEELFKLEGVGSDAKFIPKMAYIPKSGAERVIALFRSEIQGDQDIYTEFVNPDYDPEDPVRTLYKWPYNPHWEEEYEATEPHERTGHCRWLIPVDELLVVSTLHDLKNVKEVVEDIHQDDNFEELFNPNLDAPMSEMTMRDHCAIKWGKPVSHKKWLNDLILQEFNQK